MRCIGCATLLAMLLGNPLALVAQQDSRRSVVAEYAHEHLPFAAEFASYRARRQTHSAGDCRRAAKACGKACCDANRFYVRVDALFLDRDNSSRAQTVVEDAFTFQPIVTTDSLGFNFEAGPRLIAGLEDCSGWGFEGSYFGLHNWDERAVVFGNNDLAIPGDIGLATFDFVDADRMQVDYSGEFHSAELNATRRLPGCQPIRLLAGFRYVSLDELFNINSTDVNFGTSDYNIRARNDLYGGQLGVVADVCRCNYGLELVGKAGIFGNDSAQRTFLADNDNTFVLRDVSASGSATAFVGEFNVSGYAKLTECLRLHAGYNLLWIDEVALAPDQLDFTDTPTSATSLSTAGEAFFHGAHVGAEARW